MMARVDNPTRYAVRDELIEILKQIRDDWESSTDITEATGLFRDLGFESIDAVALGSSLEDHFDQSLPFAEFLTKAREQQVPDITVGRLVDFLMQSLDHAAPRRPA